MEQQRKQTQAEKAQQEQKAPKTYLDHGVDSLVAMDNPDDSELGAPQLAPKRGSRR